MNVTLSDTSVSWSASHALRFQPLSDTWWADGCCGAVCFGAPAGLSDEEAPEDGEVRDGRYSGRVLLSNVLGVQVKDASSPVRLIVRRPPLWTRFAVGQLPVSASKHATTASVVHGCWHLCAPAGPHELAKSIAGVAGVFRYTTLMGALRREGP